MVIRPCLDCGKTPPTVEFYDGVPQRCKGCHKARVRANRLAKIEKYRKFDRQRDRYPSRVAARTAYAKTAAGRTANARAKRKWTAKNPLARAAHNLLNNAIRDGRVPGKPVACQLCGATGVRLEGHHEDYCKPLDVTWMCSACHRKHHGDSGAE